jgi:hypothetical protein
MNTIRSLSRPQLIGAGFACAGLIGAAVVIKVIDSVDKVVGVTTTASAILCFGTTSLFFIETIKNIVAVIFARCGKFDFADRILNTKSSIFFNQHVFALALTASVTCAIAVIGILYLNED